MATEMDAAWQAEGGSKRDGEVDRSFFSIERWSSPTITEARQISIFSIGLTLLTCIIGLVLAISGNSAATLGYSLESLVDIISSVLVLWRFWGAGGDEAVLAMREKRASVLIAGTFVILAFVVGGTAISHLADEHKIDESGGLLALTIPSAIILTCLGFMKLHIAKVLGSFAMKKDGVVSVAAGALSAAIVLGIIIYEANESIWWIDAAFAIIIALGLGIYGTRTLLKNKWWTREFWFPADASPELQTQV